MLTQDFADMITCLNRHNVSFLLVGAFAMALKDFGAPLSAHSVSEGYFATEGNFYQLGIPPNRVDIITQISGVSYHEASRNAILGRISGFDVPILSLEFLIKNKRASGRPKDLIDIEELEKLRSQEVSR